MLLKIYKVISIITKNKIINIGNQIGLNTHNQEIDSTLATFKIANNTVKNIPIGNPPNVTFTFLYELFFIISCNF